MKIKISSFFGRLRIFCNTPFERGRVPLLNIYKFLVAALNFFSEMIIVIIFFTLLHKSPCIRARASTLKPNISKFRQAWGIKKGTIGFSVNSSIRFDILHCGSSPYGAPLSITIDGKSLQNVSLTLIIVLHGIFDKTIKN